MISWRKVGMTSSRHAPYDLGNTRATICLDRMRVSAQQMGPVGQRNTGQIVAKRA